MGAASVEELLSVDSRLTRSFVSCVVVWLTSMGWALFVAPTTPSGRIGPSWIALALFALQVGFYVWYAISAGAAAKMVGAVAWQYVVWILVAPCVALVPIPIVSTIIGASPLSIKFLLSGQLQSAIRDGTVADLRQGP